MTQTWRDLGFMVGLTTVCTILLVVVDSLYQASQAADPTVMRRALHLVGVAPGEDVRRTFDQTFTTVIRQDIPGHFFVRKKNPAIVVRAEDGPGYLGRIALLVAYDLARHTILGIAVLAHSETPGLGARLEGEKFLGQFRGLAARHGVRATKTKVQEGEFDGITGATVTSKAVEGIVNTAIRRIRMAAGPGATP